MVGNLAWAPLPAFEEVDVLDRFNGVPTLGTFGRRGNKILFWRALGYIPPNGMSVWVYVPLSPEDELHLEGAEPTELLMVQFLASSLADLAEQETVAPSRRKAARKASKAVRELVTC
jgi:hypothetical protein